MTYLFKCCFGIGDSEPGLPEIPPNPRNTPISDTISARVDVVALRTLPLAIDSRLVPTRSKISFVQFIKETASKPIEKDPDVVWFQTIQSPKEK